MIKIKRITDDMVEISSHDVELRDGKVIENEEPFHALVAVKDIRGVYMTGKKANYVVGVALIGRNHTQEYGTYPTAFGVYKSLKDEILALKRESANKEEK